MTKRKSIDGSHGPAKRAKAHPGKILVGHSKKLTLREKELFSKILHLVTKEKENPINTSSASFLSKKGSGIFMDFDSESESLYLWLKCQSGPRIKFLVHPVSMFATLAFTARRPLIAFSDDFVDSENWRLIKSTLTQIFEAEENLAEDPDFVFAFSRQGEYVHFRSYQILHLPNPSNPEKTLRFSGLVEYACFMAVDPPIPNIGANEVKTPETIELFEDRVFIGTSSAKVSLLHSAILNGSILHFVIDGVRDLSSWSGYGTCLADFKERNAPMLPARVLGTDPATIADFPNERYKHIIRSLLIEMVEMEMNGNCFYKLEDSDICLKGESVKLSWKVELQQYCVTAARSNRRRIKAIISDMFVGVCMPRDLMALLELLDCEHLTPGRYLCNHCSLMDDVSKGHLITDMYTEFKLTLVLRHKLLVAEALYHYVNKWRDAVKSNKLLHGILKHEFSANAAHSSGSSEAGRASGPSKAGRPSGRSGSVPSKAGHPSAPSEAGPGRIKCALPLGNSAGVVKEGDKMANLAEVRTLISYLMHCKMHIPDQLRALYKDKNIQLRETVRIIESKLPEILQTLQNELRYILGDEWFGRYFHQSA